MLVWVPGKIPGSWCWYQDRGSKHECRTSRCEGDWHCLLFAVETWKTTHSDHSCKHIQAYPAQVTGKAPAPQQSWQTLPWPVPYLLPPRCHSVKPSAAIPFPSFMTFSSACCLNSEWQQLPRRVSSAQVAVLLTVAVRAIPGFTPQLYHQHCSPLKAREQGSKPMQECSWYTLHLISLLVLTAEASFSPPIFNSPCSNWWFSGKVQVGC